MKNMMYTHTLGHFCSCTGFTLC